MGNHGTKGPNSGCYSTGILAGVKKFESLIDKGMDLYTVIV